MSVLDAVVFFCLCGISGCDKLRAVISRYIFPDILIRLIGHTGRIGTQIRDQTHRSISLDVHAFV